MPSFYDLQKYAALGTASHNKIVVDENLSQTSTNPVQNKTVNAALATKQDTIADLADIRSGAAAGATAVQPAEFEADQDRQEVEIGAVANAGAKNFAVPFDAISTYDITVTRNANGSYTFTCTNVSENRIIRVADIGDMTSGAYKFSGVTGGSSSTYMLGLYNTSSTAVKYQHTNLEESYTGDVSGFSLRVRVISGYSGTFTVYPMIRHASITDSTFVPYGKTNAELTNENASQQSEIDYAVNTGVKNLINLNPNTYTSGNVVVKLNDDGTVSVSLSSGSTANTTFSRAIKAITNLRGMDLILNGCPSGGNYSSGYALYISDDSTTKEKDEGNGVLVPKNTTVTTSYLALVVRSGTAISGTLTFKPMIRPACITDSTFQPYALPNSELTVAEDEDRAALAELIDSGAKNVLQFDRVGKSSIYGASYTDNGVTFELTTDGLGVKVSGTAGTNGAFVNLGLHTAVQTQINSLCDGAHVISGGTATVIVRARANSMTNYNVSDTGGGAILVETTYTGIIFVSISVPEGTVFVDSETVYPMICTAAAYKISPAYVPHRPSWQEMYDMIKALQN